MTKRAIYPYRVLAIAAASGIVGCAGDAALPREKWNVIYILADDLGYGDLGCTGSTKIRTPHIDRMCREGMLFTQHYAGCAVSAPSRSSLMTGLHTGHTPIRGNREMEGEGQEPLPAGTWTMAEMFRRAGYVTGAFGKWGLGYPGSEGDPLNQGFDRFVGYNCQRQAHRYYPDHLWRDRERLELPENRDGACRTYAPDLIQAEAFNFIRENKGRPFFLYLPVIQPHAELLVPDDELLASYRGQFPERPFVNPEGDYGPGMDVRAYCSQAEPYATYAAMVSRIDRYVGEVLALLKELGIDQKTVVCFSSDNGPHKEGGANPSYFRSSGPFRGIKRDLYEGGIHVPLIVRAPGLVKPGSVSDQNCAFWDMLPTFAQLAGIDIPDGVPCDGISLLPTLSGNEVQPSHEYLYWEFHERGGSQAVRMGYWKGVRRQLRKYGTEASVELYDLRSDPGERHDLAGMHPEVVARMREIMVEARTDSPIFNLWEKTSRKH